MLAIFATDVAVGIYSVAVAGAQVLLVTANALAISTFRRIGGDAREVSAALTARTIRHAILLAAVGGAALLPLVILTLPWTVGAQYDDVPSLLMLLIPGTIFLAAMSPLFTFFQVQVERSGGMFAFAATMLAANVLLAAALAPIWGIWGWRSPPA